MDFRTFYLQNNHIFILIFARLKVKTNKKCNLNLGFMLGLVHNKGKNG